MMVPRPPTVVIQNVTPLIDGGRYPVKRCIGEDLTIEADVFKDGHDEVSAVLKWRKSGEARWHETPMLPVPNGQDRWKGTAAFFGAGFYELTIEGWGDTFRTWQHEFHAKVAAQQSDLTSETLEGAQFIERAAALADGEDATRLRAFAAEIRSGFPMEVDDLAHSPELEALMASYSDRREATEFTLNSAELIAFVDLPGGAFGERPLDPPSPAAKAKTGKRKEAREAVGVQPSAALDDPRYNPTYPRVWLDRELAGNAAWYEFFPRSAAGTGERGSTFRECLPRLDDAKAMGFDVVYFPPIHPVGVTARKGRNNSVNCEPGEPGVPYAIGNRHQKCPNGGGHKDVAPELGTLGDFEWLVKQASDRGLEVALDFAINCSPDHPYVEAHPEWFYQRPDGTIKYAENPPKKYQDVYPLNFHNPNWRVLWDELTSVVEFWCDHGVRIFRVDNPHTKPVAFWEYLITRVQRRWPGAMFLSEAFTKPKMMRALAKAGYTQSYTYFTWRNTKVSLTEYFTELCHSDAAEVMRPNLFANTPDILPSYLQYGGRPAFIVRAVLAATLAPVYGIYSGFELCENEGLWKSGVDPAQDVRRFLHLCDTDYKVLAKEEYLDSEKYQWKDRDWEKPGNIKDTITRLNGARRENRALQQLRNLHFGRADNDLVLYYLKVTPARDNILLMVVNLDVWHTQDAIVEVPLELLRLAPDEPYEVEDLLSDERYRWHGRRNFVRLDPQRSPAHVFRLHRQTNRTTR